MTKLQAPAFAEAASRRQANNQINSNDQYPKFGYRNLVNWILFGVWDWDIGIL
jgi:hypothetical protein